MMISELCSIDNLHDISTFLNVYAQECGGGHHTEAEIEKTLYQVSTKVDQLALSIADMVTRTMASTQRVTGISDEHLKLEGGRSRG